MKIRIPDICEQRVEAVVFDLGGVILDVDFRRTVDAFAAWRIEGLTVEDVIAENGSFFRELELGLLTPEAFLRKLREEYPRLAPVPDAELWRAWNALLLPFDAERVKLLRELGRQRKIYLLSNTNLPHRVRYREQFSEQFGSDFDGLFAGCFYSDELHLRKPDPEIYRQTAGRIGLEPEKLLFIDDNEANVRQAQRSGWQAFHLIPGCCITDLFSV